MCIINTKLDLIVALEKGLEPRYLYFWSHNEERVGKKACLSQWFDAAFQLDDVRYATAEHYMMAEKARLFGDEAALERVLAATHPSDAKKAGRDVTPFEPARWNARRFEAVVEGNLAKFGQNSALKEFLLSTGERVLVEAAPNDAVWGIGVQESDPRAAHPSHWPGENLLGFALMEVRERLRLPDAEIG
jgi:ribA/ribD-fused uncharacterized protein